MKTIHDFIQKHLAICEAATGRPWECGQPIYDKLNQHGTISISQGSEMYDHAQAYCSKKRKEGHNNANFIATSRTALPQTLKALELAVEVLKVDTEGGQQKFGQTKQVLNQIAELLKGEG